jgi:hypothetical protein
MKILQTIMNVNYMQRFKPLHFKKMEFLQLKKIIVSFFVMILFIFPKSGFTQECNPDRPCPIGYDCVDGHCRKIELWFCNCTVQGYGYSGYSKCLSYCIPHCGVLNDSIATNVFSGSIFLSDFFSVLVPRPEKTTTNNNEQ